MLTLLDRLGHCWFLIAFGFVTAAVFTYLPQGREALFAAMEMGRDQHGFFFYLVVGMGGAHATLFASMLLDRKAASEPETSEVTGSPVRGYMNHFVPGLIGLLTMLLVPCLMELHIRNHPDLLPQRSHAIGGLGLLLGLITILIPLVRNRNVMDFVERSDLSEAQVRAGLGAVAWGLWVVLVFIFFFDGQSFVATTILLVGGLALTDVLSWRAGLDSEVRRIRTGMGAGFAVLWLIVGLYIVTDPVDRVPIFGSAATMVLALYFWLGAAFLIALVVGIWTIPRGILTILVLVGVGLFLTGPFNEANIRTLPPQAHRMGSLYEDMDGYARHWLEARAEAIRDAGTYPVFFVTADGGGIRAAYWTALTLAALQDAQPEFGRRIFAVSAVSGGSLGASVISALLRDADRRPLPCSASETTGGADDGAGPFERCISAVLGQDFLGPPIAALLIPDLARTLTRTNLFPNRAVVLEQTFEDAWQDAVGTTTFADPFETLWAGSDPSQDRQPYVPALFLNGTEATSGQRLVMGPVRPSAEALSLRTALSGRTVRLSTAVMMSARFPAVSPVGLFTRSDGSTVRVVDGGYFDNSGSVTAGELLHAFQQAALQLGLQERIRPVVLILTNQPDGTTTAPPAAVEDGSGLSLGASPAGAVLGPVQTLDQIRQGVTERFRAAFRHQADTLNAEVIELRLQADKVEFPLGWMLSQATRAAMHRQVRQALSDSTSDLRFVLKHLPLP